MPVREFIEEIKKAFAWELEIKAQLDNKANNLMAMSGTIATLFMGFGSFLIKDLSSANYYFFISFTILMTEVILTTFIIRYCIKSYGLRIYFFPLTSNIFFNKKGDYNYETIDLFKRSGNDKFDQRLIEDYLKGLRINSEINDSKGKQIDNAQKLFYYALIMIPIFALTLIISRLNP
jgi:hypothetical protein